MRFTQEVGTVASTSDAFKPEKVECMYQAGAAITVCKAVMPDATDGSTVITATTADDHAICGIYEGASESRGARTTLTGISTNPIGYDALSGETIWVTVNGPCLILAYESTTATTIVKRQTMAYATQAGIAVPVAAPAAGLIAPVMAMETNTTTATGGKPTLAFVRFM